MRPSSQPASVQANPSSFIPAVCCRRSFTGRRFRTGEAVAVPGKCAFESFLTRPKNWGSARP